MLCNFIFNFAGLIMMMIILFNMLYDHNFWEAYFDFKCIDQLFFVSFLAQSALARSEQ